MYVLLQVHPQVRQWALAPIATAPPRLDAPNDEAAEVSTFKPSPCYPGLEEQPLPPPPAPAARSKTPSWNNRALSRLREWTPEMLMELFLRIAQTTHLLPRLVRVEEFLRRVEGLRKERKQSRWTVFLLALSSISWTVAPSVSQWRIWHQNCTIRERNSAQKLFPWATEITIGVLETFIDLHQMNQSMIRCVQVHEILDPASKYRRRISMWRRVKVGQSRLLWASLAVLHRLIKTRAKAVNTKIVTPSIIQRSKAWAGPLEVKVQPSLAAAISQRHLRDITTPTLTIRRHWNPIHHHRRNIQ